MATPVTLGQPPEVEYPDSDGQPMSDNTLQFQWIVTLQTNLDILFKDDPTVFVAGDLLWYAVQGKPEVRAAPDALVAFGRPKGYRGSYKQWEEGGIAPQVVFEVLSPGNRPDEMARKLQFYDTYGVEEYYLYDPDNVMLTGWRRVGPSLQPIPVMHNWVSPRLKTHFDLSGPELVIYDPKGQKFLTVLEREQQRERAEQQVRDERLQREKAEQQAEETRKRVEQEREQREKAERQAKDEALQREKAEQQAKQAREQTDQERTKREQVEERARRLAEKLRELGIDPETLSD
jgi:Uma2 family endonuclease